MSATTQGYLLNGRVRYAQPAGGFRSGIEPVLLAASIPARPGQRVLEGGTGAGAGLLCLLTRVPGVEGVGIELDPDQAELARANALTRHAGACRPPRLSATPTSNSVGPGLRRDGKGEGDAMTILTGDIETVVPDGVFDHAFANPPYHTASGTASPSSARATAKRAGTDLLAIWATALAKPLRARGTLTLILPASSLPACIAAMAAAGCPADRILPLWPKAGVPAKLMIVRGIKAGRPALRLLPGLVLHEADGRFTPAADAILRDAAALSLDH